MLAKPKSKERERERERGFEETLFSLILFTLPEREIERERETLIVSWR